MDYGFLVVLTLGCLGVLPADSRTTTTASPGGCGGSLRASSTPQVLQSPGYPQNYTNNLRCQWIINADPGNSISIQFDDFFTEPNYDIVELNHLNYSGGSQPPLYVSQNFLRVTFVTDGSGRYRGFHAIYRTDDADKSSEVRLVNGKSPNEGLLEVNHNGTWYTVCDRGFDSRITEVVCRMLNYTGGHDFVKARDLYGEGNFSEPILEGLQCRGTEIDLVECTISASSRTCNHDQDIGVVCNYTGQCGEELHADWMPRTLQSPEYPNEYPRNSYCQWTIIPPPGTLVKLDFAFFSIEPKQDGGSCVNDYVELNNQRYCGQEAPEHLTSASSIVLVFQSDISGQYHGFLATYVIESIEAINLTCSQSSFDVHVDLPFLSKTEQVDPGHVIMGDPECKGNHSSDALKFSVTYGDCRSRRTLVGNFVDFAINLFYREEGEGDEIDAMRWNVLLSCRLARSEVDSIRFPGVHFNTTGVEFGSVNGSAAKVELFTDSAFTKHVVSTLNPGQVVYARVTSTVHLPDDSVLVVRNCSASPAASSRPVTPSSIITESCVVHSRTRILAAREFETYFTFPAFGFTEGGPEVVACSVIICAKNDFSESCSQTCTTNPAPPPDPDQESTTAPQAKTKILLRRLPKRV